jgi:hypothetical protein
MGFRLRFALFALILLYPGGVLARTETISVDADTRLLQGLPNANRGLQTFVTVASAERTLIGVQQDHLVAAAAGDVLISGTLRVLITSNLGNWQSGLFVNAHRMTTL